MLMLEINILKRVIKWNFIIGSIDDDGEDDRSEITVG